MFCRNCGSQLKDDAMFCHNCGTAVNGQTPPPTATVQNQPPAYQQPAYQQQPATTGGENTMAIVGFIFSLLFPIVGLICSIIGYNNSKRGAQYGGLALAGIIISAVSIVIILIAVCVIVAYLPSGRYYYYY